MKKALIVASVASMIEQFNLNNIELLQQLGYEVHVATNFVAPGNISAQKAHELAKSLEQQGVFCHEISFHRSPFRWQNLQAFKQLNALVKKEQFTLIHSHSPIGGILARIVGKLNKVPRNVYTAHGFHFFKGAPLVNWLVYYPIEWCMSWLTDELITINQEDYQRAQQHFKVKKIFKIAGVGVDTQAIASQKRHRETLRAAFGIRDDEVVLLSVGELNHNKNHLTIIKALQQLNHSAIKYFIVGMGSNQSVLEEYIEQNGLTEQVVLLGYRTDVAQLYGMADIFCFPSQREGLGLAAIEAMASGLPLLTSNVHGINDYSQSGITGYTYSPMDSQGFASGITQLLDDKQRLTMGKYNAELAKQYDKSVVNASMYAIYQGENAPTA
ncbi:MAG: glycosyltransferase family 4 protein [Aerococcaceae bacterium]|nr:glycosyltransferase family 4 protein [Aerococcaceae bacterium]